MDINPAVLQEAAQPEGPQHLAAAKAHEANEQYDLAAEFYGKAVDAYDVSPIGWAAHRKQREMLAKLAS